MKTRTILQILQVFSWILFIGVCIEAAGSIFSAFYTLVINPINASTYWVGNDLSALYKFDPGHFLAETMYISIAGVLKACIFYLIIKILYNKKLNMSQPFNTEVRSFIIKVSCLAFGIALFTWWGVKYTGWLVSQGVKMPDTEHLRLGGADVWLFMGVILFVIAQIFKRGIEIQTENELTV
ncbi:MAG: DUF2975 domain-containing protein [Ferruginibacter sp.]